jgi:hypothetical protein
MTYRGKPDGPVSTMDTLDEPRKKSCQLGEELPALQLGGLAQTVFWPHEVLISAKSL